MGIFEQNLRKAMMGGKMKQVGEKEKVKEKVDNKTNGSSNEQIRDPKTETSKDKKCERDKKDKRTPRAEASEKEKTKSKREKASCSKYSDHESEYITDSDSSEEFERNTALLRADPSKGKANNAPKCTVVSNDKRKKPTKRQIKDSSNDSDNSESHRHSKHFREAPGDPEAQRSSDSDMSEDEIEIEVESEVNPSLERVPITTPMENLASFLVALPLSRENQIAGGRLLQELAGQLQREEQEVHEMRKFYVQENRQLRAKVDRLEADIKEIKKTKENNKGNSLEEKLNQLSMKLDSFMAEKSSGVKETPVSKPLLYSDIIKTNKRTKKIAKKAEIQKARPMAAIYPVDGSGIKNSDETKQALAKCINPAEHGIKIRNLRKIRNSGVLIETETTEDLEQVLGNNKVKEKLKIGSLPKRKPKIIIFGVPSVTTEAELRKAITSQNLELVSEEKSEEEFKLLFKTGKKDKDTTNWVAEVSPQTRKILLARSRVFVGFNAYGVKDFIAASRCYKCHAFGHVSKHCKSKLDTCGHCGKDGHAFKECPNKKEKPTCINCKRAGIPANHSIREQSCPAYKHAIEKCLSLIDFG